MIEEFEPDLIYLKGKDNVAADAMSRLPAKNLSELNSNDVITQKGESMSPEYVADHYGLEELPDGTFPLRYKVLDEYQKADKDLIKALKTGKYTAKTFRGGGKELLLIVHEGRIIVPEVLRKYVIDWYHT